MNLIILCLQYNYAALNLIYNAARPISAQDVYFANFFCCTDATLHRVFILFHPRNCLSIGPRDVLKRNPTTGPHSYLI